MRYISKNTKETIALGERLAKKCKAGDIIAIMGDLGAGKTVFAKGIARGLGVKNAQYVNSPTFVIIKEYKGRIPLYHCDLYRLNHSSYIDLESYDEYFYGKGVTVVEWANKLGKLLPERRIEVVLKVAGEEKRVITIKKLYKK